VTEYIQQNLDKDLTLGELAAVVYMSPYHFARLFKGSTGVPPHRFVVRQRIARARAFLAAQEQSVAQISRLVGFRTPSHFTTVLRRVTGLTPGAYRTAACEQSGPAGKEGEMNVSGSVVERTYQKPSVDEGRPIYPRQGMDRDAALVAQLDTGLGREPFDRLTAPTLAIERLRKTVMAITDLPTAPCHHIPLEVIERPRR